MRKDEPGIESINKFNEAVRFWEDELASEIAVICAKLNFTKSDVESLTIQQRKLYLDKIQEMFGKKEPTPQHGAQQPKSIDDRFPMSPGDQNLANMHKNRFEK